MTAPARRRRSVTLAVAALAAVLVVLAGCTSTVDGVGTARRAPGGGASAAPNSSGAGSAAPSTAPAQPAANFFDCQNLITSSGVHFPPGRLARLHFTCSIIEVPLDYSKPSGVKIKLAMVRVHDSRDTNPIGQLLMNPGGPGASGVELAAGLSPKIPDGILEHFDLIGFDPRGVGSSTPIKCISDRRQDTLTALAPNVLTAAGLKQAKSLSKSVADACSQKYGAGLAQYNTVNTARDMDQIRQAVGDPRMNYLGFSYGTELGSVYANLFPTKVRVMVLDGAVDPYTNDIQSFANQLKGFEGAFNQFAAYCLKTAPCKSLGSPRKAVYAVQAAAKRAPIPSSKPGETRKATFSLVTTGVLQSLYSRSLWPTLGNALIAARKGNSAGLLSLADQYNERYAGGKYSNISDANTTISCNDSKPGPTDTAVRATARRWQQRFPIFGLESAPGLLGCQQWQPDRDPPPLPKAATTRKVLVIGNLHDPATPYQGAIDLAKAMGNAEVLSWNGQGHTSYLQGSTCINSYVDRYLIGGSLPPANKTCPA